MKRTPIRYRSRKMAALYVQRRRLVRDLLEAFPVCVRCHAQPSAEVHEIKSRARSGSILDPDNCVALCHTCHAWITANPALALDAGWLKNSWEETA